MGIFKTVLIVLEAICSLALIVVVLLQSFGAGSRHLSLQGIDSPLVCIECGEIGMAQRVFVFEAAVVLFLSRLVMDI